MEFLSLQKKKQASIPTVFFLYTILKPLLLKDFSTFLTGEAQSASRVRGRT